VEKSRADVKLNMLIYWSKGVSPIPSLYCDNHLCLGNPLDCDFGARLSLSCFHAVAESGRVFASSSIKQFRVVLSSANPSQIFAENLWKALHNEIQCKEWT